MEDDVQGIDINDCTSKSLKCTAIHLAPREAYKLLEIVGNLVRDLEIFT